MLLIIAMCGIMPTLMLPSKGAMTDSRMRTLEVAGGKRTGIRLDSATWQAVDWISEQHGKKWADWAREVIRKNPGADNMTALIREAAMETLLAETIFSSRGQDLAKMEGNALTRNSAALDDRQLDEFLKVAIVQGESDFVAFRVIFGNDEHGRDFLAIRNGMRDLLHFVTVFEEEPK